MMGSLISSNLGHPSLAPWLLRILGVMLTCSWWLPTTVCSKLLLPVQFLISYLQTLHVLQLPFLILFCFAPNLDRALLPSFSKAPFFDFGRWQDGWSRRTAGSEFSTKSHSHTFPSFSPAQWCPSPLHLLITPPRPHPYPFSSVLSLRYQLLTFPFYPSCYLEQFKSLLLYLSHLNKPVHLWTCLSHSIFPQDKLYCPSVYGSGCSFLF